MYPNSEFHFASQLISREVTRRDIFSSEKTKLTRESVDEIKVANCGLLNIHLIYRANIDYIPFIPVRVKIIPNPIQLFEHHGEETSRDAWRVTFVQVNSIPPQLWFAASRTLANWCEIRT